MPGAEWVRVTHFLHRPDHGHPERNRRQPLAGGQRSPSRPAPAPALVGFGHWWPD